MVNLLIVIYLFEMFKAIILFALCSIILSYTHQAQIQNFFDLRVSGSVTVTLVQSTNGKSYIRAQVQSQSSIGSQLDFFGMGPELYQIQGPSTNLGVKVTVFYGAALRSLTSQRNALVSVNSWNVLHHGSSVTAGNASTINILQVQGNGLNIRCTNSSMIIIRSGSIGSSTAYVTGKSQVFLGKNLKIANFNTRAVTVEQGSSINRTFD